MESSGISGAAPDPGGYDELKLDRQLCFALYAANNKIIKLYRSLLQPVGITFAQHLALMALWEKSPRTINELARTLEIEGNTVTPLVQRMELIGVVSRSRDAVDERQVNIHVTPKGYDIREYALAMRKKLICDLGLTDKEISDLRSSLRSLSDLIDNRQNDID